MISSLYLHIPFCRSKCSYCSFSSYPGMEALHTAYVEALEKELRSLAAAFGQGTSLSTVFCGGGTPTVLSGIQLSRLLEVCFSCFPAERECEVSIEANPGTISGEKLYRLREAGFNRISLGVQSFSEAELRLLGRGHTSDEAVKGVEAARAAGFENISLDLMYGIPGQDRASWQDNLERALTLSPHHLSLYQLTFEDQTPLATRYADGELDPVDDDVVLQMDADNLAATRRQGLVMYEISNFCLPGFECRHNINYWLNGDYLGAGAGAVSYVHGRRERRYRDPRRYIKAVAVGGTAIVEGEQLNLEETFRETVIMGLRMCRGVSLAGLRDRFGLDLLHYYGPVLAKLLDGNLVELADGCLRVTEKGRLFSNMVMAELV